MVTDFKEPAADANYEIYRLTTEPNMADGFSCSVILDKNCSDIGSSAVVNSRVGRPFMDRLESRH